jgi:hypothetical protein
MTPPKAIASAAPTSVPQNFDSWIGCPVILHTAVGELCVPLRGTVLAEAPTVLRFRIGEGWDVDIYKSMIIGIEKACWTSVT